MVLTPVPFLFCLGLAPQGGAEELAPVLPMPSATVSTPAPSAGGARRWIVVLKDRSFDLDAFADAQRDEDAERVRIVVGELERAVRSDQADLVRQWGEHDIEVAAQWWLVNALAIEATDAQLDVVRRHPRVAWVHADHLVRPGEFIRTSTNANNHGTDRVQALGILGTGTTIAVVDSGLDVDTNGSGRPHTTFFVDGDPTNPSGGGIGGSRVRANVQVGLLSPDDPIDHGTAVAAVALGAAWNGRPAADDGHAPRATAVGYALADLPSGVTTVATITSAWQQVATDAVRFGIDVAVCSYEGTALTQASDQIAIDALANTTDVVVVGMGGNGGSNSFTGYGAVNMIAVGATLPNSKQVATFSARGPLFGSLDRRYPDLVANGVDMEVPVADAEGQIATRQGTSFSAPQVAGAAALYREVRPSASATEVKAAILATTQDISAQNPTPPFNSSNAYGTGYLDVPALVWVAQGRGLRVDSTVDPATPERRFRLPVVAGATYGVAVTWFRSDPNRQWSDLDLDVEWSGAPIASSAGVANTSEHLRFTAPGTGTAEIVVRGRSLFPVANPTQGFSVVGVDLSPNFAPGSLTSFGSSCRVSPLLQPELVDAGGDRPLIGGFYSLLYRPANAVGFPAQLFVGASDSRLGAFALPLDLTPFGAPNCSLYTSSNVGIGIPFNVGFRQVVVRVPNDPRLVGVTVFHQAVEPLNGGNALGAVFSNAFRATIGG